MPAMTADAIVDRIRSVCIGTPFGLIESPRWDNFDDVPTTAIDGCFRLVPPASQSTSGLFDYAEDRVDVVQIWVARKHKNDYPAVRRALLRDVHSLTAAIVRDAHEDSGDYAVFDGGRGHAISADIAGAEFATLRLSLPVNYEAQL